MQIQNAAITGSFTYNGVDISSITGSTSNITSLNAITASILSTTGSLNTASGSAITRLSALEVTSGSNITRLSALETASGSAITRLGALEVTSGSNITRLGALETASGSAITRLSSIESKTGSYATTGSNTFVDGQYLSSSFNPTGFSTTASLYTDGGLRVTRDAYISGTLYLNNVTVFGTQSVAYISSSQLNIGTNLITVNTDTPSIRFGGLSVYDSGSTGLTGSILWDSQNNHWIYSNPSGSSYSGGMFISGPRTSTLGSETGTTSCALMMGQGGDHITSSAIFSYGNATCFYGNSFISSSGAACFGGALTGTTSCFSGNITTAGCIGIGTNAAATPLHIATAGLPAIRLTLGSEARCHNINGVNLGRDLQVLPFRHFSVQTGNGITEGQIVLNAYEDFIVGTGASYTSRLNITPTGIATFCCSIGIGTGTITNSSNYNMLRINGTTGGEIAIAGGGTDYGYMYGNSSNFVIATQTNIPLIFQTNTINRIRVAGTGEVTFCCALGAPSAGISSTSISTTPSTTLSTSRGIMVDAATTTNNAFVPIGFSWASSVSTYDPTWGMALKTVSYNAGTADLVFYTAGNVRMTINNGGGTSFTGGVTATQLTANADNSGVIADVAGRHGLMKYFNYGTGLVGRNTETDGSISTWLGRFAGSITSPTTVFQDLVITNGGRVGIGTLSPSQNLGVIGAIKSSVSTTDGAAIAIAYGRTLYKVFVSSNYDGGNAVRAGEWNVLTNNEGTGITNTTQIYNYNSQSATFSVSGGNIIISGLSAGNNQAAVFTN